MVLEFKRRSATTWETEQALPLGAESFRNLLQNKIPLIRIAGFATPQECEALAAQADAARFNAYQNVVPKIERIGITVFEYNSIGKSFYFEAVNNARNEQQAITSATFDPLQRLMSMIEVQTGLETRIASEPSHGNYHAGLIRKIEHGTQLHIDYAPSEQPGWEVGSVASQLSWNIYLQVSSRNGGKTHVYNRQWKPGDDQYKLDSYGYRHGVIQGEQSVSFQPEVGDVFLFNTRNYHFVEPTDGYRMTFTSALGILPNQDVIFWS